MMRKTFFLMQRSIAHFCGHSWDVICSITNHSELDRIQCIGAFRNLSDEIKCQLSWLYWCSIDRNGYNLSGKILWWWSMIYCFSRMHYTSLNLNSLVMINNQSISFFILDRISFFLFEELLLLLFAFLLGGIQKVCSLRRGAGVLEKWTKTNRGREVLACVYVHFLKKKC